MIDRKDFQTINEYLETYPVVVVIGARQVGKTTLAKYIQQRNIESIYLDLELPSDQAKLKEPELFFSSYKNRLIILDEIQLQPDIFPVIRAIVDQTGNSGQFLVTGSAAPDLLRQSSQTLAGRIHYKELNPITLQELPEENTVDELWLQGGFPEAILRDERNSFVWRQDFIKTFLNRDLPGYFKMSADIPVGRLWELLANMSGQEFRPSKISKNLGISQKTVHRYIEMFENLFMIRRIPPYSRNIGKRLVKSPKLFIRDSGILHALLGIENMDRLLAHPVVGASWEGFIIEQIISHLPAETKFSFFRTHAGAEADLILENISIQPIIVEIKRTLSPVIGKGFRNIMTDVQAEMGFIVYAGDENYPLSSKIDAISINNLDAILK